MGQYSSYYLYQKYVSREGGDFVPVYPEVYSIDADGTMPKVIRLEEDTACGFNPNPYVKYRWYVKYTSENDYICYNYSKYYYEYYQVSYNNGLTWQDVIPIQKRRSSTVWEANSYDCGYEGDKYEWRKMVGEYICVDCGDEPSPSPLFKLYNTENTNVYEQACTSDGRITTGMTNTLDKSAYNRLEIGGCCKTLGVDAFNGWTSLQGDLVIPNNVTYIDFRAFQNCSGFTGTLTLGTGLTEIAASAFLRCSGFTGSLTLPTELTSIGNSSFMYCSGFVGDLVIPDKVKNIENYAFNSCSGFNSLTIGTDVTRIGVTSFADCYGLSGNLIIPDSVKTIDKQAFSHCTGFNGTLKLGTGLTSIGDYAFANCGGFTGNLIIPDKVETIGNFAFVGCSGFTGTLTLPTELTSIGEWAFANCSGFTGNLIIPNKVISIGDLAFNGCSGFTGNLIIPDKVETIGDSAFRFCSNLTSVTIGTGATLIDRFAFDRCSNLKAIYCKATTPPRIMEDALGPFNDTNDCPIYVPYNSVDAYKVADYWKNYARRIVGY